MGNRERFATFVGGFEDQLTEMHYRVLSPLMKKFGVEMTLTKGREERVEYFTQKLREIQGKGDIKRIRFAAGGDDGDLDDFLEALIRSGVLPSPETLERIKQVRIIEKPKGRAPEEVRNSWVGIELKAISVAANEIDELLGAEVRGVYPDNNVLIFGGNEVEVIEPS